jgi:ribosome maturation factor RimP
MPIFVLANQKKKKAGTIKSLFYFSKMIKKQTVIDLAKTQLEGSDKFIVDVKVSAANKIEVYVDSPKHISIADCVDLSRFIEKSLDREKDDFELQVSSPGATEPFKVIEQYKKYIGTKVSVLTKEGNKHEGILQSADDEGFVLEETRKEKKPVGKGNHTVVENINLTYNQIKETKSVLPF